MISIAGATSDQSARQNLTWLFLLRNFLIAGESFILIITVYLVSYEVPERSLWAIISIAMIVNSLTWYRLQYDYTVTELELFIHIIFDVFGITAILYCTGGAANPFSWFFILPVMITATVLPQIYTWITLGLTSVCYTALIGFNLPLPTPTPIDPDFATNLPKVIVEFQSENTIDLRVFAVWFGFLLIAGIVSYFIVQMTNTLRERDKRLAQVREQALRDERIVALGALAAGAAHEMGTPLGTMAILTHDLEQEFSRAEFSELQAKMRILREQINRCNEALSVMSASAGQIRAESGNIMPLEEYLDDLILQWQDQRPNIKLHYKIRVSEKYPALLADRTLTQALINILDNAADASPHWVEMRGDWNESEIIIEIRDNGPGVNPAVAESAGKKPITTKKQGLGVGLLLSHSTINRLGGSLKMFNLMESGACSKITLPIVSSALIHE